MLKSGSGLSPKGVDCDGAPTISSLASVGARCLFPGALQCAVFARHRAVNPVSLGFIRKVHWGRASPDVDDRLTNRELGP